MYQHRVWVTIQFAATTCWLQCSRFVDQQTSWQWLAIESMCQVYLSTNNNHRVSRHWWGSWHNNTGPALSHWLIKRLSVKISLNFWKPWLVCIVLFICYHKIKIQMLLKLFLRSLKVWHFRCCHNFTMRPRWTPSSHSGTISQLNLNSPL